MGPQTILQACMRFSYRNGRPQQIEGHELRRGTGWGEATEAI